MTNRDESPENALASGPEIFSEVYIRYQEWAKKPASEKLLSSRTLRQLDEAGPLPVFLRSHSQFMVYVINSRDNSKETKFGCIFLGIAATVFVVIIMTSFLVRPIAFRIALWSVAGVCVIAGGVLILLRTRSEDE